MLTCSNCGSTQTSGDFCGKCGAPLNKSSEQPGFMNPEPINAAPSSRPPKPEGQQQEDMFEKESRVKKRHSFGSFLVNSFKRPSQLDDDSHFLYGLICWIVAFFLWTGAAFLLASRVVSYIYERLYSIFVGDVTAEVTLGYDVYLRILLGFLIFYVIGALITFLLAKALGTMTLKQFISQLGALSIYASIGFLLTMAITLLGGYVVASTTFSIVTSIFILLTPIVIVMKAARRKGTVDPFIAALVTIIAFIIYYYVAYSLYSDTLINSIENLY